jgi:hypothetical protein
MKNAANNYMVEGHGAGYLTHRGQETRYNRGLPYFSREQAWAAVKELQTEGLCHTIKVRRAGELVWTAYSHDGWTGRKAA